MPKQAVAVELFYDGVWNDLVASSDVLADTPIVITRGDGDESAAPRPSSISLRLANDDDRFRTSNPLSPLYGKAGVNTPLRVSVGGVVRGYAEASSWEAGQTPDFRATPKRGVSWVDVTGGGLLQRVGQWTQPVKSPLRVATESLAGLIGYWPLEDKAGTVYGSPLVPNTISTFMGGHSFGSQNSPPGGGTAVDKAIGGDFPGFHVAPGGDPNGTIGWQHNKVIFLGELDDSVGSGNNIATVGLLNGSTVILYTTPSAGTTTLTLTDNSGSIVATSSPSTAGYAWSGRWIMVHIEATYSGGTTTITAYWGAVGVGLSSFSISYTGVPSDVFSVESDIIGGSSFGHMAIVKGFSSSLRSTARQDAFASHPGELASARFGRLCDESGIPYYVSAGFADSSPLGPQGVDPLAKQFEEVRNTEDGLLFDYRTEGRLFFLARGDRQNQTPALTLDTLARPTGLPALPTEVTDDQTIHNIVTASQRGGGDSTAEDATSAMGTQAPPNGRGVYQQTVNVNVADPDVKLAQEANWYLRRGTVDKPRYPQVTVDLTSLGAAAIAIVEAVDVGDVIQIVNYREYTIRLFVIGYTETIGTHTRTITFTCAPDQQFDVGVLDTNRLQAKSTTLNAGITSTATSLTLKTTDVNEQWRTGANAVPVLIGGELITLGTVAARSGTGPWTQAVTGCTRSVNGIVKTHSTGDAVSVVGTIRLTLREAS